MNTSIQRSTVGLAWHRGPWWSRAGLRVWWWAESVWCAIAGRAGPGERLLAEHLRIATCLASEREDTLRDGQVVRVRARVLESGS